MKKPVLLLVAIAVVLAFTNPNEAAFREHIRKKEGIAGSLGMAVADLISGGKKGGIQRDNFLIASRFYIGGDGVLPREDLAWGIAGMFIETKSYPSR
ncbi:MAG: hypothetical protein V4662_22670 [Verrucomicrobiota bacterium]